MHLVKVYRYGADFNAVMAQMRTWIDHHKAEPSLFEVAFLPHRIEACEYGINGGLRRMSDLETPEADMMRDHSSVDAAPATLRLEESQPGLDPNNPGVAPDTTRG